MKNIFKTFFIIFMLIISLGANNAQAFASQSINVLNDAVISSKEDISEINDIKRENIVLTVNSAKNLKALNKKTPHSPFLISQNGLTHKKSSIFYYSGGINNFPPASYSVKTNDIRAP